MRSKSFRLACLTAMLPGVMTLPLYAGWQGGRYLDEEKTLSLRIHIGHIDGLKGEVEETKRPGTDGVTDEGRFLETYTFEELGFEDSFATLGVEVEKLWRLFTAHLDLKYARIESRATARRIYAIGVESVSFGGREYEYMLIPDGARFNAEMDALMADAKLKFTPFHLTSETRWIAFTPWVLGGLFVLAADFSIDAGQPQGVTTYELDPYPYVIGGRASGTSGGLLPQIGVGGELRMGLGETRGSLIEWVIQGEYSFLDLVANTGDFGVSARNEKNVDTSFTNLELRTQLEWPLSDSTDFVVGAGLKVLDIEASITADRLAPGETTTEKYDKEGTMEMTSYFLFAGFNF